MINGLYVITDTKLTPYDQIVRCVGQALKGGASIVQLREKLMPDDELKPYAMSLRDLCSEHGALFIINDRVKLAREVEADGLHIGQEDEAFEKARDSLPDSIIGVSCYGDIERALHCEKAGADYVAFGAVFNSSAKPLASVTGTEVLSLAKKTLSIPVCAIGGITLGNIHAIAETGCDMAAIITDVWKAENIESHVRALSGAMRR